MMIRIILLAVLFLVSCEYVPSVEEAYSKKKEDFNKVVSLRDELLKRCPACYSLHIENGKKTFWMFCDSIKPNQHGQAVVTYLLSENESEFLGSFMSYCGIWKVNMSPNVVRFMFSNAGDEVVRTDTSIAKYNAYQLDSLYYLLPSTVLKPD
ncbi:hypothetical protein CLV59_109258 [Chitinophaga dinghuensis]|uniref:Lipoprotein n=1 Tax=Chitinophaga dinghuensis TaxID=1539050 RepID=A0A327VLH6_9BACT|nr:hypothetical protein [Chitinophaga dinghuensis]RAJ75644.1 hypothetical protein CLV59_109258 [Chitinophaga dinghuensis]